MTLDQFMGKLSADMELEQPFAANIPNVYSIPLEEGFAISITSPSSERFDLSCTLGPCPTVDREAFFTELLLANLFGQGTRGAVLGTDIEANQLTLVQNIDRHIEYKEFKDIVEDFINMADFWRQEATGNTPSDSQE